MELSEHATLTVTAKDIVLFTASGADVLHPETGNIIRAMSALDELSIAGWEVVSSTLNQESETFARGLLHG